MFLGIGADVIQRMRPGSNHAHLAFQDVPQLWKLVQTVTAQQSSDTRDSRIVGDLEEWPRSLIVLSECVFQIVGIPHHGAKLVAMERPAFSSCTERFIKDR